MKSRMAIGAPPAGRLQRKITRINEQKRKNEEMCAEHNAKYDSCHQGQIVNLPTEHNPKSKDN
jgi:hypothetical protein